VHVAGCLIGKSSLGPALDWLGKVKNRVGAE